jgi:hypothetical protein
VGEAVWFITKDREKSQYEPAHDQPFSLSLGAVKLEEEYPRAVKNVALHVLASITLKAGMAP